MRRFAIGMIVATVAAAAVATLLASMGAAVTVAVGAASQTQQDAAGELPDVTFTVDVNYVEVEAVVTDSAGRPVTGLTADDFELYEDGRRQDVSTVSFVDLPIAPAASSPVLP